MAKRTIGIYKGFVLYCALYIYNGFYNAGS